MRANGGLCTYSSFASRTRSLRRDYSFPGVDCLTGLVSFVQRERVGNYCEGSGPRHLLNRTSMPVAAISPISAVRCEPRGVITNAVPHSEDRLSIVEFLP